MEIIFLNGAWNLHQNGRAESTPATVPGCVHTDLLAAGQIADPYYRDNELDVMWIGEADWAYRRRFTVSDDFLAHARVLLRCDGLDTLATIRVNNAVIGKTDNMFRLWEWDVKAQLVTGENSIEVYFDAPVRYARTRHAERPLPAWGEGVTLRGANWLRKEPCNFGWDWGPRLVTCGIWRDISLLAFDIARIADVHIRQDHTRADGVGLAIHVAVEPVDDTAVTARCSVSFDGAAVAEPVLLPVRQASASADLVIAEPRLWWPNGMGKQPLHDVQVELLGAAGEILDTVSKRIGLRTLRLERHDDEWGESFCFSANGVPFFAKGANWIPADTFATRVAPKDYARLLTDAAAVHMNLLRVWGGGIYEDDVFYALCDELGLCIWQDFIFSCAAYPAFDEAWLANVKAEAEDNVRRIRHHACLALWCGNNELEQGLVGEEWTDHTMSWEDYGTLFDQLLPDVVNRLDPDRDYWPCSPHSPRGDRHNWRNPDWGDTHLWGVWHELEPFEWYRARNDRFVSEFGFQSFPEPRTVATYTQPEDRNITSLVMEHHQRSGTGNAKIIHYLLDWFRLPESFALTLWHSQILQGMAMKYAVEHWRRNMPRSMGALYWQLNDCWPVASWSSIDSLGRWKALHYRARHFYAPLLVSGLEDVAAGTVDIHITSDRQQDVAGEVAWYLTDTGGRLIGAGCQPVDIPARRNTLVKTLQIGDHIAEHGARKLLLWLELQSERRLVAQNLVFFARPKHLELQRPKIATDIEEIGDSQFRVRLTTNRPALWVWLEVQRRTARFSDNFFHIRPGKTVEITVSLPEDKLIIEEFDERLVIRSLVDAGYNI